MNGECCTGATREPLGAIVSSEKFVTTPSTSRPLSECCTSPRPRDCCPREKCLSRIFQRNFKIFAALSITFKNLKIFDWLPANLKYMKAAQFTDSFPVNQFWVCFQLSYPRHVDRSYASSRSPPRSCCGRRPQLRSVVEEGRQRNQEERGGTIFALGLRKY